MGFPLGDIIRKLGIGGWIGKIFSRTKGISIGGIDLSEGHGPNISKPGESKFDRTPSKPKPPFGPAAIVALCFLLPACEVVPPDAGTPPPPCIEGHIWGDGINAYHLGHDALWVTFDNQSSYTPDLDSWNALGTPLNLEAGSGGFPLTIIEGGDRNSGWLGMASISIDADGHIQSGEVTMNKAILDDYTTNTATHVLCQEIGHLLGLEHNRAELDTCMNDCADAADFRACLNLDFGKTPNAHDGETLKEVYAHAGDPPTPPCVEGVVLLHTFGIVEDAEESEELETPEE